MNKFVAYLSVLAMAVFVFGVSSPVAHAGKPKQGQAKKKQQPKKYYVNGHEVPKAIYDHYQQTKKLEALQNKAVAWNR
jgi:hypothetical protein